MIQKKICMLGAPMVGKTSLVERFVQNGFSDRYQTTMGVKINRKEVTLGGEDLRLILWDIQGDDGSLTFINSYLRGAAGYLLVVDGTRRPTFHTAREIQKSVERVMGPVPFVFIINKSDLADEWDIDDQTLSEISGQHGPINQTSAKLGQGVDDAFLSLARQIFAKHLPRPDSVNR